MKFNFMKHLIINKKTSNFTKNSGCEFRCHKKIKRKRASNYNHGKGEMWLLHVSFETFLINSENKCKK